MDTEEIRKNRYWIAKANNTKSYPVMIGGDSRVFRGISPDDFKAEFNGYETYNYAFWSNGMCRAKVGDTKWNIRDCAYERNKDTWGLTFADEEDRDGITWLV